jgi:hypothetical protein
VDAQVDAAGALPARERHPARGSRLAAIWAEHWPIVALGVVAVLVSVVVHHWIYPAYSWNRDEPVYLWQVHALRDGQILPTDGGMPAFFQPWLSGHGNGYFFSQYTLGWPIVLLVGEVVFGTAASALVFGTLLAVVGTYAFARTITADRTISILSAVLMLASPILAVQSGVYLGYLFTLGLGLLFGAALITGFERRRPLLLVAAGALVGWIFMTRPFDAVLWAAAFGLYLVVVHWRAFRRLATAALWTGLGALPLVIATLAYNRKVTGSFTQFPITAADPLDTFGFGLRRLMPSFGKDDYNLGLAFRSAGKNAVFLPLFLFGSYLGVIAAGFGLWIRRRQPTTLALVFLALAFPLGYFFFWGMHVSASTANLSGPIYFIPLYAPFVILIATALVRWWDERRGFGIAAVVALTVVTIPFAINRIDVNKRISDAQVPWRDGTDAVHDKSIVFVQQSGAYLLFLNPFSENPANLDGRILWATDQGGANLDLIAQHPDRTPYLQRTTVPPSSGSPGSNPVTPVVTTQRLHVLKSATFAIHARITNPTDSPVVVASIQVGSEPAQSRVIATDSTNGAVYDVVWQVVAPGVGTAANASPIVTLPLGAGTASVAAGFAGTVTAATARQSVRSVIPFRAGQEAEFLLPVQPARLGRLNTSLGWIDLPATPELRVEVTKS